MRKKQSAKNIRISNRNKICRNIRRNMPKNLPRDININICINMRNNIRRYVCPSISRTWKEKYAQIHFNHIQQLMNSSFRIISVIPLDITSSVLRSPPPPLPATRFDWPHRSGPSLTSQWAPGALYSLVRLSELDIHLWK